jgi:hypothetical protein
MSAEANSFMLPPLRLFSRPGARCHNAPIVQSRPPKVATRAPQVAKLTQRSRARQYEKIKRSAPRCVVFSGERDGGAHRAEEPCSLWGVQDQIAQLHPRCLAVAPWRPAVRDEPTEGPNQGAALQPGEAPADRRPLRHEQEPTATSGRRKKPLKFCLAPRMRGKHRLSRGSGRACGDPLLRRPPHIISKPRLRRVSASAQAGG